MNLDKLIQAILSQAKGAERTIVQERPAKTKKSFAGNLIKRSVIRCRFVNYEAQKTTKQARENGRKEMPNNWESHVETHCDGLFTDHKGKLKVCVGHSAFGHKGKKEFVLNGKPVELEQVKPFLLASEYKKSDSMPDWYTLEAQNIKEIDGIKL